MEHFICYRLNRLPDFLTARYTTLFGGDVRTRVMAAQEATLRLFHSLGELGGLTLSLRYLFDGDAPPGRGLSLFFFIKNNLGVDDDKICHLVENSPLGAFYPFETKERQGVFKKIAWSELPEAVKTPSRFGVAAEIIKEEGQFNSLLERYQGTDPTLLGSPFRKIPYHVIYPFEPVADNDMTFLDRQFHAFNQPLMVEITLSPTTITPDEAQAVTKILGALEEITSAGSISINTSLSATVPMQRDVLAEMVQERLHEIQETAFTEKFFEFAIRVFGDDATYVGSLGDLTVLSGNAGGRYRKFIFAKGEEGFDAVAGASAAMEADSGVFWKAYWDRVPPKYQTFNNIRRFCRLAHVAELAPFFRVIVPNTEPLQTIPLETEYDFVPGEDRSALVLGRDFFKPSRAVHVELEQLKKHMFIAGVPGSGKTTALYSILFQLWCEGKPFMVIEPAKTEYRLLKRLKTLEREDAEGEDGDLARAAGALGRELRVYTVGNDLISPFRFNPFEFPEGIGLYEHISNVEACFRGALPISTGPLPALINEATEAIYSDLGWNPDDVADGTRPFPTMQDLHDKIGTIFETKDYSADVKGDLKTAIEVRIGTLLRRNMGRIFNTRTSSPDITTLMEEPIVLELDYLNEEQANLLTLFVLARVREYVRATRTSKSDLAHVIVLEEAHNIIGKTDGAAGEGQADPKAEATKYVARFLAEVRALGEGLIIADQLPSAVAPEVVKNTNIKLIHRLVAADDREEIGMTMLLDPSQMADLARLSPGEAYLYQEGMYKPSRVKELYIADTFEVLKEAPPTHKELIQMLQEEEWWAEAVFSPAPMLGEAMEALGRELEAKIRQLLEASLRAQQEGEDSGAFREILRQYQRLGQGFQRRYDDIRAQMTSFFQLMHRRSQRCAGIVEEKCRPALSRGDQHLNTLFSQWYELGEEIVNIIQSVD